MINLKEKKSQKPETGTEETDVLDLSIVIVSYNVKEFLEQALQSILKASQTLALEIFVVDNRSSDGSSEMVRRKFPQVKLIENEINLGFAAANNQALSQA